MAKKKSNDLMEKLFQTIEKVGIKKTSHILDEGQIKYHDETSSKISYIISKTCELYKTTEEELKKSKSKNDRTEALSIIYFLMLKKSELKAVQIANYWQKDIAQVSRGIKKIKELSDTHPVDKKIKENLNIVTDSYQKEFTK